MTGLPPATALRPREAARLLHIDPRSEHVHDHRLTELPKLLEPGDLLVVNDAATLPALLPAAMPDGAALELRLLEAPSDEGLAWAMTYRRGTWRTRTEERDGPGPLSPGTRVQIGGSSLWAEVIEVSALSERLILLLFEGAPDAVTGQIYRAGRPIQYSYLEEELPLWAFQTPFARRPWAVEAPSAGLMLSFEVFAALARRSVQLATLTHGAGLSSTGDPRVDRRLPLSERYEIPESTVRMIEATKARRGRVISVGTTVARALEGASRRGGRGLEPGRGRTSLKIGPDTRLQVIDGLLTGMHLPGESHFEILRALASDDLLARSHDHALASGYLAHELGDCTLVLGASSGPAG